jgi:hypothetical protein
MRTRLPHPRPLPRAPLARARRRERRVPAPDPEVVRARRAGGPIDRASYSCQCGYVFLAPVSTTVACPHCEAQQPW